MWNTRQVRALGDNLAGDATRGRRSWTALSRATERAPHTASLGRDPAIPGELTGNAAHVP